MCARYLPLFCGNNRGTSVFKIHPPLATQQGNLRHWIELAGGVVLETEERDPHEIPIVDLDWVMKTHDNVSLTNNYICDYFHPSFVYDSREWEHVFDLNCYRIGDSKFKQYDANKILQGKLAWGELTLLSKGRPRKKKSRVNLCYIDELCLQTGLPSDSEEENIEEGSAYKQRNPKLVSKNSRKTGARNDVLERVRTANASNNTMSNGSSSCTQRQGEKSVSRPKNVQPTFNGTEKAEESTQHLSSKQRTPATPASERKKVSGKKRKLIQTPTTEIVPAKLQKPSTPSTSLAIVATKNGASCSQKAEHVKDVEDLDHDAPVSKKKKRSSGNGKKRSSSSKQIENSRVENENTSDQRPEMENEQEISKLNGKKSKFRNPGTYSPTLGLCPSVPSSNHTDSMLNGGEELAVVLAPVVSPNIKLNKNIGKTRSATMVSITSGNVSSNQIIPNGIIDQAYTQFAPKISKKNSTNSRAAGIENSIVDLPPATRIDGNMNGEILVERDETTEADDINEYLGESEMPKSNEGKNKRRISRRDMLSNIIKPGEESIPGTSVKTVIRDTRSKSFQLDCTIINTETVKVDDCLTSTQNSHIKPIVAALVNDNRRSSRRSASTGTIGINFASSQKQIVGVKLTPEHHNCTSMMSKSLPQPPPNGLIVTPVTKKTYECDCGYKSKTSYHLRVHKKKRHGNT